MFQRIGVCLVLLLSHAVALGQVNPPPPALGQAPQPPLDLAVIPPQTLLPATISFDISYGLMVIRSKVGDEPPLLSILATSLPYCVVGTDYARKLKLATTSPAEVPSMYGPVKMLKTIVPKLMLEQTQINTVPFVVGDLYQNLTNQAFQDAPAIWIGNSALAMGVLTIDARARVIKIANAKAALPQKAVVVPFEFKNGQIVLNVKVNGVKQFPAILDTSVNGTLLPVEVGKALLTPATSSIPAKHPNGKEGTFSVITLRELALGDLKLNDISAFYLSEGDGGGMDPLMGIIGREVLLRYRVTIHYPLRKVAFEPF